VTPDLSGQGQLGADTIRCCDQQRISVTGGFRVEQAAKAANTADNAAAVS